jgi:hypothetical protein
MNIHFFKKACSFEAALILVAVALGWIANINPFENLHFSESAIAYGVIGTMPLFFAVPGYGADAADSVVKIKNVLYETLGPSLSLPLD